MKSHAEGSGDEQQSSSNVFELLLGTPVPAVEKESGKSCSSDSQFCLNSLVPNRYLVVVSLFIYSYTVRLSDINEPVRVKFFKLWEPVPPLSYFA